MKQTSNAFVLALYQVWTTGMSSSALAYADEGLDLQEQYPFGLLIL